MSSRSVRRSTISRPGGARPVPDRHSFPAGSGLVAFGAATGVMPLAKPDLLEADQDAEYAAVIEIDLADIKEPILCCPNDPNDPNDPDDAKPLSAVQNTRIDEVFIGSCMTNIGHFRAAELTKEGPYGARTEMPGCSLCMGNQAQVREGATVVPTSTRNFPNRPAEMESVVGEAAMPWGIWWREWLETSRSFAHPSANDRSSAEPAGRRSRPDNGHLAPAL